MKSTVIRAKLRQKPFRPVEFVLDNGEVVRIGTPEIFVAEDAVVTTDRRGQIVLISPESISLIRPANGNGHGRRHSG